MQENAGNTMIVEDDKRSAHRILTALAKAQQDFEPYQALCDEIDVVYSEAFDTWSNSLIRDPEYDLFWAYTEVMKPALYARTPIPVVAPMFNDRRQLYVTTAEMLERAEMSAFLRADIDESMRCTRDDMIFYGRGVQWVTYVDEDGKKICVDHIDRKDFRHPKARKWSEVPWVARGVWMYRDEWEGRFEDKEFIARPNANPGQDEEDHCDQARVWEVWHKLDKKVYWVAEGCPEILDETEPHLDLRGFFPCPRPAYGSTRPNSLMPIPDYARYVGHFRQVNSLTRRIYTLLDRIRMKGLIPSGGDVGTAVEALLADDTNASFLIPIDSAAMMNNPTGFVQWMPLAEIAEAIQGLMASRQEIFADFDRLSGISDIMRGETDAQETLGAQRLKSQYGSIRIRGKIDELVRVAKDVTQIAAEIMAEEFDQKTLLDMSQMEIPTKAELKRRISEVEGAAEEEMKGLMKQAQEAMAQQQGDPQQAQAQLQQAQQQIIQKYAPQLKQLSDTVPIEAVMELLRDDKARGFAFEIQTDSTIMTDENSAKASANEFYAAFTGGMQGLVQAASMGPEVMRAASEVFKMVLQPYRPPRSVTAAIDDMLDAAPQIAETMQAQQGEGDDMAGLAEAEMEKAKAQMAKVEADSMLKQAELQQRMAQMQVDMQEKQAKMALEAQRLEQDNAKLSLAAQEMQAKIDNIRADTMKKLTEAQVSVDAQALDQFKSLADIELKASQQAQAAQQTQVDTAFRVRDGERQAQMSDRPQALAERQAMQKPD